MNQSPFEKILSEQADLRIRIAELEKELAALREAQRWIPVGERLPEVADCDWVSDQVLVVYGEHDGSRDICSYVPQNWKTDEWTYKAGWYRPGYSTPQTAKITAWQPLPQPPEEVEG